MDKTRQRPASILDAVMELTNGNPAMAINLVAAIQDIFPQVNDQTKIKRVDSPYQQMAVSRQAPPKPETRTRAVRKPGYRWQFHRAFYELMDLPAFAAWGWYDEPYTVYPIIERPEIRNIPFKMIAVMPEFFGARFDPNGSVWRYFVAYIADQDLLLVCPPR